MSTLTARPSWTNRHTALMKVTLPEPIWDIIWLATCELIVPWEEGILPEFK